MYKGACKEISGASRGVRDQVYAVAIVEGPLDTR